MDNLTPNFRKKHILEFKDDKTYVFRLVNLKKNPAMGDLMIPASVSIKNMDVVFDPYKNSGENVPIEYVSAYNNTGPDSHKDVQKILGEISFRKKMNGEIRISGKDKGKKGLFEFLYLSSANKSNIGKPYHIKGTSYYFEYVDMEEKAANRMHLERQAHKAASIAFELEEQQLRIVCEQLAKVRGNAFTYNPSMGDDVLREQLVTYAKKYPERVIVLDDDFQLAAREAIKDAESRGIIIIDKAKRQIIWGANKTTICVIPPKIDAEDVLVSHFLSEDGGTILKMIMTQLEKNEIDA